MAAVMLARPARRKNDRRLAAAWIASEIEFEEGVGKLFIAVESAAPSLLDAYRSEKGTKTQSSRNMSQFRIAEERILRNMRMAGIRRGTGGGLSPCLPVHRFTNPNRDEAGTLESVSEQTHPLMIRTLRCAVLALALTTSAAFAAENPKVGGHEMYSTKNIVENASKSDDHTTLVAAVKAAGLVETLEGKGPFTVFAPTNEAFEALPKGTVETLLKPENKKKLTGILTYHVVAGDYTAEKLAEEIKEGKGKATLKTVEGEKLTLMMGDGGKGIEIKDAKGNVAMVSIADVKQSNGVIHVINKVLMP